MRALLVFVLAAALGFAARQAPIVEAPMCELPPASFEPLRPTRPKLVKLGERTLRAKLDRFVRQVGGPTMTDLRVAALVDNILATARRHRLDPVLLAGILAQESAFRPGLFVCQPRRASPTGHSCDAGIGQVNWETWSGELALDQKRLVYDDAYNIDVVATILVTLRKQFSSMTEDWWHYYHSFKPEHQERYALLVLGRLMRSGLCYK